MLYRLSYQANWELATLRVRNIPVEGISFSAVQIYELSYIHISSSLKPGSKAFTGDNNLLVIFLKVEMEMEPDLAHSLFLTS